jgi:membrane-associated phospholipid phosphatase
MPRRAVLALLGALTGVGLLVLTWFAAFHFGVVERVDASVLRGFVDLRRPVIDGVASVIAKLCDPKPYVCLAAVVVLPALIRRRGRVAVAAAGIMLAANVTTQILKPALGGFHPVALESGGHSVGAGAWPSGHATAAMSLALCAVLVSSARWRPFVAAAGAAFAVAVSFSFLILIWHYPSDVLGGFLVAGTWTLIGVAAVWTADGRSARSPAVPLTAREALGPPAAAVLGALALVGLVVLARPHAVIDYARAHTAFVVGAIAIGALSITLATGLMLATTFRRR